MGYDDLKVVEAYRLVQSIATGEAQGATVDDALRAPRLSRQSLSPLAADAGSR
jgi:hypothetical protein